MNKLLRRIFPRWMSRTELFPYLGSKTFGNFLPMENWGSKCSMAPHIIFPLWKKIIDNEPEFSDVDRNVSRGMYDLACRFGSTPSIGSNFSGSFDLDGRTFAYDICLSSPGEEPYVKLTLCHEACKIEIGCSKWNLAYRKWDVSDDCAFDIAITKSVLEQETSFKLSWYHMEYVGPVFLGGFMDFFKKVSCKTSWWRMRYDPYDWWYPKGENALEIEEFWPFMKVLENEFLKPLGLTCLRAE